ncbi:Gfo/Idh/MocA family oxidoreductase [uncultured Marinobacter sp.]|uniref:Gfo/Idh/MocA family protein n=1 Tax=uncultured Marinobacter sp. TaxID=187379 RepID=UPI002621415E|nr:Gfo/Idh/MocA family oxidoreductase [uncultured Marinobacter sp.]
MRRALVVGSGSIAKRHIRNFRDLYPDVEVVCVSSSGRQIAASDVGATSVVDMIEAAVLDKPDVAIVASPANFHLAHAEKILKANIPVLIEKPLCVDISELAEFSSDQLKSKVAVGYNLRFMPAAKAVKEVIVSGDLGRISTVFSEVGQYLPDWRPDTDYRKGVSAQKWLGGGALLELSHELDYLNWLFGNISEVSAVTGSSTILDVDVEDTVDALLTNQSGIVFHLHLDFLQRSPSRSLKVVGEKGTLIWNLLANEVVLQSSSVTSEVIFSDRNYDRNEMYVEQLRAFVAFAKGDGEFDSTLGSSIEVMRLVEAIRLSDQQRAWVNLEAIK